MSFSHSCCSPSCSHMIHSFISRYQINVSIFYLQCLNHSIWVENKHQQLQQLLSILPGDWIFEHPFIGFKDRYMLIAPARNFVRLVPKNGRMIRFYFLPVDLALFHFQLSERKGKNDLCIFFWMYPPSTLDGEDIHAYANVSLPSLPDASFLNPPITTHHIPLQSRKLTQRPPAGQKQSFGINYKNMKIHKNVSLIKKCSCYPRREFIIKMWRCRIDPVHIRLPQPNLLHEWVLSI